MFGDSKVLRILSCHCQTFFCITLLKLVCNASDTLGKLTSEWRNLYTLAFWNLTYVTAISHSWPILVIYKIAVFLDYHKKVCYPLPFVRNLMGFLINSLTVIMGTFLILRGILESLSFSDI